MDSKNRFVRDATGLVREMGPRDALYYTILSQGLVGSTNLYLFLNGPASFPGGNLALSWLIGILVVLPMAVTYSMLASAMPRSGGDYVYQSRVLHPALGFAFVLGGAVVFMASFAPWCVWALNEGMSPFLTVLGIYLGNQGLINFGTWVTGYWGILLVGIIAVIFALVNLLYGLKPYIRLQRVMFWGAIVYVIILGALAVTVNFPNVYNAFMLHFQQNPDLYNYTISSARADGFVTNPPFSWAATFALVPITFTASYGYMWSTYSAGEIKGGSVLKNQMLIVVGGAIAFGVLVAIVTYLNSISAGYEFINAMSYHYSNGTSVGSLPFAGSSFLLFTAVVSSSPIILLILLFAFVVQQIQYFFSLSIAQIRVLFAMSFDRLFPEKMTTVSERLQSPWVATAFVGGLEILWVLLYLNVAIITQYFTVMMFTTTLVMALTQLSAILFPYRCKEIFETSPCRKYKVAGVPAVTIFGILGLFCAFLMEYYYFTVPLYGGFSSNPAVIGLNVALVIGCAIYYYLARWYRKRQGINLDLAFKVVPPE